MGIKKKAAVVRITTHSDFSDALRHEGSGAVVDVVDIASEAFGPCKVIPFVLDDLLTVGEVQDDTEVRLLQVNSTKVLRSLNPQTSTHSSDTSDTDDESTSSTSSHPPPPTPTSFHASTLPPFWEPHLRSQERHSKPLLLFYKDGEYKEKVSGCHTPLIKHILKALGNEAKPPAHYLHANPVFLAQWEAVFGGEVDIPWQGFVQAVHTWLKLTAGAPSMTDVELMILSEKVRARERWTRYNNYSMPERGRQQTNKESVYIRALWQSGVVFLSNIALFAQGDGMSFEEVLFAVLPDFARRCRLWRDLGCDGATLRGPLKSALKQPKGESSSEQPKRSVTFQESHTSHHLEDNVGEEGNIENEEENDDETQHSGDEENEEAEEEDAETEPEAEGEGEAELPLEDAATDADEHLPEDASTTKAVDGEVPTVDPSTPLDRVATDADENLPSDPAPSEADPGTNAPATEAVCGEVQTVDPSSTPLDRVAIDADEPLPSDQAPSEADPGLPTEASTTEAFCGGEEGAAADPSSVDAPQEPTTEVGVEGVVGIGEGDNPSLHGVEVVQK